MFFSSFTKICLFGTLDEPFQLRSTRRETGALPITEQLILLAKIGQKFCLYFVTFSWLNNIMVRQNFCPPDHPPFLWCTERLLCYVGVSLGFLEKKN